MTGSCYLYQKLGLLSVGRMVFKLPTSVHDQIRYCNGTHQEIRFIDCIGLTAQVSIYWMGKQFSVLFYSSKGMWVLWFHCTAIKWIRIVQGQIRKWLWRRRCERRLALAMAFHPRLGAHAPISALLPELMTSC